MKTYSVDGRAGCVQLRRSRCTGTQVGVYRADQAGLDPEGGAWVTVCEEHDEVANHETLREALWHAPAVDWCEECQALRASQGAPEGVSS